MGDETDGYDEIIYPCDYLRTGIISDDEMYDLLVKELPAGVQLTALVDACHSGKLISFLIRNRGAVMWRCNDGAVY